MAWLRPNHRGRAKPVGQRLEKVAGAMLLSVRDCFQDGQHQGLEVRHGSLVPAATLRQEMIRRIGRSRLGLLPATR